MSGRGNSGVGTMLIRCLFITQFAGYLAASMFGDATAHAPYVMQWRAWSTFPRRVMDVNDSARVDCPIFLADNSHDFTFASSTFTLDPAPDKANVTLDGPIIDRPSSTSAWSTAIKASPVDSFISGRGNSGVGTMLIRCLFITQMVNGDMHQMHLNPLMRARPSAMSSQPPPDDHFRLPPVHEHPST
ncbi:hypothetical protein HPB52_022483 [Rhipicephalus sanguineus]|uniref:Uncharacterized protein n=1 Tax=Rhipicephalus sanguineus TaxID=34632 RepID=A0A9D4Q8I6_RHISA|nr:hypothetical protein HPB52_022483 [Rhipicephalus sanguineus]